MAVKFTQVDRNIAALQCTPDEDVASGADFELCRLNVLTGRAASEVLPKSWVHSLSTNLKQLLQYSGSDAMSDVFVDQLIRVASPGGALAAELSVLAGDAEGEYVVYCTGESAYQTYLVNLRRTNEETLFIGGSTPSVPQTVVEEYRVYHVAIGGDDATADGTLSKPFATVSAALAGVASVNPLEYVHIAVAPGSYGGFTVSRPRTIVRGAGISPEDHSTTITGPVVVDCPSATSKFNDVVGLKGMLLVRGLSVTGAGSFMVDVESSYVTTSIKTANAFVCTATNVARPIVYFRNCTISRESSGSDLAEAPAVNLQRGDVRFDTVRVYASVPGTADCVIVNNNASLTGDRVIVDSDLAGAGIRVDGALAGIQMTLSNSSVRTTNIGATASPALYLKNTTGPAAYLWNCALTTEKLSGCYAIDGVANSIAGVATLYHAGVVFGMNPTVAPSVAGDKAALTPLT